PGHLGLETGAAVKVELPADRFAVRQDLGRMRVLLPGYVADLLEQRQVDVGFDVALRARVAVPVPGAAEVAALFDDAHVVDPGLAQARAREQSAEATADHHHFYIAGDRVAGEARLDVRIIHEVCELARDLDGLSIAIG